MIHELLPCFSVPTCKAGWSSKIQLSLNRKRVVVVVVLVVIAILRLAGHSCTELAGTESWNEWGLGQFSKSTVKTNWWFKRKFYQANFCSLGFFVPSMVKGKKNSTGKGKTSINLYLHVICHWYWVGGRSKFYLSVNFCGILWQGPKLRTLNGYINGFRWRAKGCNVSCCRCMRLFMSYFNDIDIT